MTHRNMDLGVSSNRSGMSDMVFQNIQLTVCGMPANIYLRARKARIGFARIGMSSNGRTADSGSVSEGSTPSIPAISSMVLPDVLRYNTNMAPMHTVHRHQTWLVRLAVRTPPSQGGGHGFESRTGYQLSKRPPRGVFSYHFCRSG